MAFFTDVNNSDPQVRPKLVDTEAVGQMVSDFLLTRKGERLFNLNYGLDLDSSLFDLIDPQNALILFSQVTTQLEQNLPIVKVNPLASSIVADPDKNTYEINVSYAISGLENDRFSTKVTLGGRDV